jgi:hypothetical protein
MGHRNLLPCDPPYLSHRCLPLRYQGSVRRASGFVLVGKSSKCMFTSGRFFGQLTDSMIFLVHWKRCADSLQDSGATRYSATGAL